MSSILFLLFLLSITTLFSKFHIKGELGSTISAPIFILLGYMVSPQAIGLVLPSVIQSSLPAVRFSIFLVSFIAGFQFLKESLGKDLRSERTENFTFAISFIILIFALLFFFQKFGIIEQQFKGSYELFGLSLILLGLFFRGLEIIPILIVSLGETIRHYHGFNLELGLYYLTSLAVIIVLFLCIVLLVGRKNVNPITFKLTLLGVLILGSGITAISSVNEVLVGFLSGILFLYFYKKYDMSLFKIKEIEAPFLLFIYLFFGLYLQIEWGSFVLGAAFALFRIWYIRYFGTSNTPLIQQIKIQKISIPLAFSLYYLAKPPIHNSFFLSTLIAGLIVTEIVGLQLLATNKGAQNA